MKGNKAVLGIFTYVDDAVNAIAEINKTGLDYRVYSPVPNHEIEERAIPKKSKVRNVTFFGAIIGLIFGWSLQVLCSYDWPIRVSAKDVVAPPSFFVVGYECTILFGAIATLLALLRFCRIPDLLRKVGYDPRFSDDKFGVVVGCESSRVDEVRGKLSGAGAIEVEVRDGL